MTTQNRQASLPDARPEAPIMHREKLSYFSFEIFYAHVNMSDERPISALKFALLGDFIHFVQADSNIYTPKRILTDLHNNTEVVQAGIVHCKSSRLK